MEEINPEAEMIGLKSSPEFIVRLIKDLTQQTKNFG